MSTKTVAMYAARCARLGIALPQEQSSETKSALRKCIKIASEIRDLERMALAAGVLYPDIAVEVRNAIGEIDAIRRAVETAGRTQ